MSPTAAQMGVSLASGGIHLKMIGFWAVAVLVVLAGVLLVWRALAKTRRFQQVTDDWRPHAHTDEGKER
jgi:hypothetical protein